MDFIHIAYALDNQFAEMTCVSICSVLKNTTGQVMFHIIESRLSAEHINKIKFLIDKYPHGAYKFYHIDIDDKTYVTSAATKVTKETYAKAMLPDLLVELDRVLWLDGDTVVEEDIAQLWTTDLGDDYAAMVPDTSMAPKEPKKAALNLSGWYFNTGVILMDLSALRKIKLSSTLEEKLPDIHHAVLEAGLDWFAEQDMLNYLLKGHTKKLPLKFNSYLWESETAGFGLAELADAFGHPVIIHFIGANKPTRITRRLFSNPQWYRYYHYKAFTPYAADTDAEQIECYQIRTDNLINAALLPNDMYYYSLLTHLKKELFEQAYTRIISNIGDRKLVIWGLNNVTEFLTGFLTGKGLEVVDVVDGVSINWNYFVFDKQVRPTETVSGGSSQYFVLMDMRSNAIAEQVKQKLLDWNYSDKDFYYIYSPLWE